MDGDKTTKMHVDLTGANYEMSRGIALEGRYLGQITKAELCKTNDGQGVNVSTAIKIIGPKPCSELGKIVYRDVPVPIGDPKDMKVSGKQFYFSLLIGSLISASGLNNPDRKPIAKEAIEGLGVVRAMSPEDINGALCFIDVTIVKQAQGRKKGEDRNDTAFILHEDFIEAPGPNSGVVDGTVDGTQASGGQPNVVPTTVPDAIPAALGTIPVVPDAVPAALPTAPGGAGAASSFLDGN